MLRRPMFVALLCAALVSTLAACGTGQGAGAGAQDLSALRDKGVLRVGVAESSPPFGSRNPGTEKEEGFDVDLATEIAKELGNLDAQFTSVTPETRIPLLQQNQLDVVLATMSITDERKKQIDFSRSYFPSGIAIMVPEGSSIKEHLDILGKTNCDLKGAVAQEYLDKGMQQLYGKSGNKTINLRTYPECVLAIKQGRADFIGTDLGTLIGLQKQTDGLRILPGVVGETPFGVGMAKNKPELLKGVNDALLKIFEDGRWSALYKKWIGGDLPDGWPPAK